MKTQFKHVGIILAALAMLLFAGALPAWGGSNLIVNGDFSGGNTGFTSSYVFGNVSGPGTYTINTEPCLAAGHFSDWGCFNGPFGSGNVLIANGAASSVWSETVSVMPSTVYTFTYWAAEVDAVSGSVPQLALDINSVFQGSDFLGVNSPSAGGAWQQFTFTWNSGSNTSAVLDLSDLNSAVNFNDFALADLSFTANSSTAPTPEPGTLLLVTSGLLGFVPFLRSRLARC